MLLFVDTNDCSIMAKQEHVDLSDVEWDPTGRYVTSYVNIHNAKVSRKEYRMKVHRSFLFIFSAIIRLKFGHFKEISSLKRMPNVY